MFSGGGAYSIKDLKEFRAFLDRGYYRHAGPKGPEEIFFTGVIAGACPPRYGRIKTRRSLLPEIKPRGLAYRTHQNMKPPRLRASQILTTSTSPVSNERFAARVTANVFTASA